MKLSFRACVATALLGGIGACSALAQDVAVPAPVVAPAPTNAAPAIVLPEAAPKTNKPAAKPVAKKPVAKKPAPAVKKPAPAPEKKAEPVLHPEPAVARQNHINVRAQASLNSEVITHLQKNQAVTILEEVNQKKAKQDEPSQWFRISLPTNTAVWVHASFIDDASKTVKPNRLNLRGGPSENHSIVGRLEKGAVVKPIETKGDWIKIEAPADAHGFVAAHLLERKPVTPPIIAAKPVEPVIIPGPPILEATIKPPTTPVLAQNPSIPPVTPPPAETVTPPPTTPPVIPAPPVTEPVPEAEVEKVKKIVSREGLLKGSVSIQAPAHYELRSLDTGKTINYVFSPSTNLVLKEFKGKRIIVTGEEVLDERWQFTPVIVVDSLETVP